MAIPNDATLQSLYLQGQPNSHQTGLALCWMAGYGMRVPSSISVPLEILLPAWRTGSQLDTTYKQAASNSHVAGLEAVAAQGAADLVPR